MARINQSFSASDVALIATVNHEYQNASPAPRNRSWDAFIAETMFQYGQLIERGWKFAFSAVNPYATSDEMFGDCEHLFLKVFTGGILSDDHPLAMIVTITDGWEKQTVALNDIFRAVHDVNGHYAPSIYSNHRPGFVGGGRAEFETFSGELQAYRNHMRLYSQDAIPALFSETIGQLCYYYANQSFVEVQEPKIISPRAI